MCPAHHTKCCWPSLLLGDAADPAQLTACQNPTPHPRGAAWPCQPQTASLKTSIFQEHSLVSTRAGFHEVLSGTSSQLSSHKHSEYATYPLQTWHACFVLSLSPLVAMLNSNDSSQETPCCILLITHLWTDHNPLSTNLKPQVSNQFSHVLPLRMQCPSLDERTLWKALL